MPHRVVFSMKRAYTGVIALALLLVSLTVFGDDSLRPLIRKRAIVTEPPVNTFSIVAYDPDRQEWGVAVASKYLAVGNTVPWAKAGTGAVATQAAVNILHGPNGLELLAKGMSAEEVL